MTDKLIKLGVPKKLLKRKLKEKDKINRMLSKKKKKIKKK